jgi:hypothetical protein
MHETPQRQPSPTQSSLVTRRLSPDDMAEHFEKFNKRFLSLESTDVADVEVFSPSFGDQVVAAGAHLIGITYEPRKHSLEVELDSGDVRAFAPKEVWTVEEADGFIRAIEIVGNDDTSEIVRVRRLGVQKAD